MNEIKLESVPRLIAHFDPAKWQATNPMQHPEVYKLNQEQLQEWGEVTTTIRRKFEKKAENYTIFSRVAIEEDEKPKSRRCVPHSTRKSNPEGLLEDQIRKREKSSAGVTA